jgi:hypothetical protein
MNLTLKEKAKKLKSLPQRLRSLKEEKKSSRSNLKNARRPISRRKMNLLDLVRAMRISRLPSITSNQSLMDSREIQRIQFKVTIESSK